MNVQSIYNNNRIDTLETPFSVYLHQKLDVIYIDLHKSDANVCYKIYNRKRKLIKEEYNLSQRNTLSLHSFPTDLYIIEVSDDIHKVVKTILKL